MEEKRQKERLHYETDGDSDESKRTHNTSAAAAARNRFVQQQLSLESVMWILEMECI
ncbi:Hypothetical protein SMAX5B_016000 [Scophthalmus maximus]|uniref:Uncharacterized protein n=1 Tax=Scophthalmus maximus TaxID=52904 RepID=A0A2U9CS46_SCOMX|nr:Hypothetical protein SMAX5B_016000 [Scophthalmus maximus]